MSKPPKTPEASPVAAFEKALEELESVVSAMERGEQSLDESLAAYERGIALYRQCQSALEQAEQRVTLVNNTANPEQQTPFRDNDAD
ncbi:exodeoxyribonuclease VII small subunit [Arenimonas sp. GDDSR-1]|uniref:exodeoxyribonuclease VII small subunit n=1 Tax=Arenimonas sp. GDDSR-1 TaxID=2950125 RepID=UPI00262D4781|nr:exodeoxyribonuclease VII small subunit [Arenimonas sp. GDDSR-1]